MSKAKTFQELTTLAHDMELIIAYYGRQLKDDESMAPSRNISFTLKDFKESEHPYYEHDAS